MSNFSQTLAIYNPQGMNHSGESNFPDSIKTFY